MSNNKPVRATFMSLYGRPESDAEFVSSMTAGDGRRRPALVDSYSCRQMFLRSYTFSMAKKRSIPEMTKRCLEKAKDHAGSSLRSSPEHCHRLQTRRIWIGEKKRKIKGCAVAVRRLRRVSVGAIRFLFRRLFTCNPIVDAAAGADSDR